MYEAAERIVNGACLQLHSDGGFDGARGSAAVVVVLFSRVRDEWAPSVLGYRGTYVPEARSAFHAEIVAAEMAICTALEIGQACA